MDSKLSSAYWDGLCIALLKLLSIGLSACSDLNRTRMRKIIFCVALFNSVTFINAQQKSSLVELNMDLPDETEETSVVEKGEVQIESAYLHTSFSKGYQPSIIQSMIRYGIIKKLELRLLIEDGNFRDKYLEETTQATSPLALSLKYSLLKDHKSLPDITVVGYLKLPFTSHTSNQSLYWSPIFSLAFHNKLGENWAVDYNPGIMQEPFGTSWQSFFNASLHYNITNQLDVFSEYYGQYQSGESPQHNAGFGMSYQFNNTFEIFSVVGSTFNYAPYNRFVSLGFAVRI